MTYLTKAVATEGNQPEDKKEQKPIIGKNHPQIVDGHYTPEIMWSMGRIVGYAACPGVGKIIYAVGYTCIKENTTHVELHCMDSDGKNDVLLTQTASNETNPQWIKKGTKIAFLSDESGSNQIWEMNPDGTERKKLSDFKKDIDSFLFAPDSQQVLFISQTP